MICKLCEIRKADQTGSHIVPHFIMKRIDNQLGSKQRDKELGFIISEKGTKSYFGRAISPESLEKTYGVITDELISKNANPQIEDYIFCSLCEKKLSFLESYYSNTLKVFDPKALYYTSDKNSFICLLFWLSIIWRLSISEKSGFRLLPKHEKCLRRILCTYLSNDLNTILPIKSDKNLYQLSYKLFRCPNYSDKNPTLLFCHPEYRKPYFFIIDEYILTLNFGTKYAYKSSNLGSSLPVSEIVNVVNKPYNGENIIVISKKSYNQEFQKFNNKGARLWLNNLSKELNYLHQKLGGKGAHMPKTIQEEIAQGVIRDNVPVGHKYTEEHKLKIIEKVLKKYSKKSGKNNLEEE